MKSPGRWVLIGLVVAGGGLAYGLIPQSEEYSDWGFGDEGLVDVQCGSAFSEDVDPQFRDWQEGEQYRADRRTGYDPPIFEGQTADEVCEDLIDGVRVVAIAGLAGGALLAIVGIVGAAGSSQTTATLALQEAPPPPAPPLSPPPPASPPSPASSPDAAPPPAPSEASPRATPVPLAAPPPSEPVSITLAESSIEAVSYPLLVFSDGRRVQLVGQAVIGRDPTVPSGSPSAEAIAVSDATVSKTHVLVGATRGEVWIEDLHSRNGVSIVTPNGSTITASPGRRMIVDVGERVVVGDMTDFTVGSGSDGPPGATR